ncbi:MAG: hypothetical protein JWO80_624 [Bryobacterales bacterium]|nr:hypothetical protein [Bryobacterales bacterium]
MTHAPVAALRKFVRPRESQERCDLCGAELTSEHRHNFDPASRRIRCACDSCGILYASVYRQIPRRVRALPNFQMSDAQWDDLMIPISLAFFSYSTPAGKVVALYPGPAGAAESLLRLDAWEEISTSNPELRDMEPDVEALLVNRVGATREHFLVPIDECYKLVGLIRLHWRGLSGGAAVWGEIARFFDELRRKGEACPI